MYAHEYGLKNFKHKTNFNNLVVFSDTQQTKIKDTLPSSKNIYLEIEKGVNTPNKWFIHFNSRLSGEYGDFYIENNDPFGTITDGFESINTEESIAFIDTYIADFSGQEIPYYQINENFYIKIDNNLDLDEIVIQAKPSPKPRPIQSIEYDAFITLLISDNGAKLEAAYQRITDVSAHQIVIFIEANGGTNAFGTVFRLKKGKNVKTLLEVDRITLSQIAKAYGVEINSYELTTMVQEELKDDDSQFYLVAKKALSYGGKVIRWTSDEIFTGVSSGVQSISKEIDALKLGDTYWRMEIDGKENPKFNPLLPKLKDETKGINTEAFIKSVYSNYIFPLTEKATKVTQEILSNKVLARLVPFDLNRIIKVLDTIPELLQEFFETVIDSLADLYHFINGLLVGLINSIIDFIKSFFDILAMLFDVLNGIIQGTKFFESPGSYLSLFAENFENLIDTFVNIFTLKNLKQFFVFIASLPKFAYTAVVAIINTPISINIDPSAIGYYLGFFVGFIASEVATFFASGGTGNITKALKAVLKSYREILTIPSTVVKNTAKVANATVKFGMDTFARLWDIIIEFSKNIPQHIKTLEKLIGDFIRNLRKIARPFSDDVYTIFEKLGIGIKKAPKQPILASGIPIPVGDGLFALIKDGKEIFRGTKKQVQELSKVLERLNDKSKSKLINRILDKSNGTLKLSRVGLSKLDTFVDEALQIPKEIRTGAAAVLEGTINGKLEVLVNYTSKGLKKSQIRGRRHKLVDNWLEIIAKRDYPHLFQRRNHGRCAEPINISEWLFKSEESLGIKKNGMTIDQARVIFSDVVSKAKSIENSGVDKLSHGLHKNACRTCNPLLSYFNIKQVF
ncbi:YwqJ-related putative deaminase [Tenacibaculum jejuense]|uniref:Uncharacterized protein n=1 Tax=Tenacibaculum jejuense TaxID=584609 RepID=A0A238UF59_9FLAO|nr:YwqJ-related putative deaminase [Tenacibaculum jejuense]SNR17732.1 protein of unknown function [Tenacibaculum jejuense]